MGDRLPDGSDSKLGENASHGRVSSSAEGRPFEKVFLLQ